jgi:hypothetical protein
MLPNNWYGDVTIENIKEVAEKMKSILSGKRYTFVAVNMYGVAGGWAGEQGQLISEPEVRTSQELKPGTNGDSLSVWFDKENSSPTYAGFNFCDSYGVWGLSTHIPSDNEPHYNIPYAVFEWGHKIKIAHRAPAGHILYWTIALEEATQ